MTATVFFVTICLIALLRQASAEFPDGCRYVAPTGGMGFFQELECSSDYNFPKTFDVAGIPQNLRTLYLGNCTRAGKSVLSSSFVPIPPRYGLVFLRLCGFQDHNNDTFPLNDFLRYVKSGLTELHIFYGALRQLTSETLRGFSSLRKLSIISTNLQSVAVHSLNFRGFGSSAIDTLVEVAFTGNNITELDWSVFAPHESSLQDINVGGNAITSLNLTRTVRLRALRSLSLAHNRLSFIPSNILQTLASSSLWIFSVNDNAFCTSRTDCQCCELEPIVSWANRTSPTVFIQWLPQLPASATSVTFFMSCGPGPYQCPANATSTSNCERLYNKAQAAALFSQFEQCDENK